MCQAKLTKPKTPIQLAPATITLRPTIQGGLAQPLELQPNLVNFMGDHHHQAQGPLVSSMEVPIHLGQVQQGITLELPLHLVGSHLVRGYLGSFHLDRGLLDSSPPDQELQDNSLVTLLREPLCNTHLESQAHSPLVQVHH